MTFECCGQACFLLSLRYTNHGTQSQGVEHCLPTTFDSLGFFPFYELLEYHASDGFLSFSLPATILLGDGNFLNHCPLLFPSAKAVLLGVSLIQFPPKHRDWYAGVLLVSAPRISACEERKEGGWEKEEVELICSCRKNLHQFHGQLWCWMA